MIEKSDTTCPDFSIALPVLTDKLTAVQATRAGVAYNEYEILESEAASGLSHILTDVIQDLRTINKALYPLPNGTLPIIPNQEDTQCPTKSSQTN